MKRVLIIGFGRFGALLASLSKDEYEVSVAETNITRQKLAIEKGFRFVDITVAPEFDYIFLAVPISKIESVLQILKPLVNKEQVVIDICSVKVYPAQLMQKYILNAQILATHPLFGPDSASQGLKGLKVAFCTLRISSDNAQDIKAFWEKKGAEVIDTTPEQHDKDSVYSQAFTYSIAKIITSMKIPELTFTTRSYQNIKEVADLSANDSETLFNDMLSYNPYLQSMTQDLNIAICNTLKRIKQIKARQVQSSTESTLITDSI